MNTIFQLCQHTRVDIITPIRRDSEKNVLLIEPIIRNDHTTENMNWSKGLVISSFLLLVQSFEGLALDLKNLQRLNTNPNPAGDTDPLGTLLSNEQCESSASRRALCASAAAAVLPLIAPTTVAANSETVTPLKSFQVEMEVALDEVQTGKIIIEVKPEWAPLAAERFEQLLGDDYFTNAKFFRVLPNYVAQFGIAASPEVNKKWMFDKSKALNDEPRLQPNKKGTLSFASSGKNSRQTQIFINLSNNDGPPNFLDAQGFVPFARVIKGMDDIVPKLYSGYGIMESATAGMAGSVNQGKAAYYGNEYLEALFPKLSTIQKVTRMN